MRVDKGGPEVKYWVGCDVAKTFHWVSVLDDEGNEVLSRQVEATQEDLEALCLQIDRLGGERRVGIDLLGGPAALLEAVLLERGERIFDVPGVAVNRARDAYGGETPRAILGTHGSSLTSSGCAGGRYPRSAFGGKLQPRCGHWSATAGTWSRSRPGASPDSGGSFWRCFRDWRRPSISPGKAPC